MEKKKVKVLVTQLCPTLCNPLDCSPPGSSVHDVSQARIQELVVILFSRVSSLPRDQTHISYISCIGKRFLDHQHLMGIILFSNLNRKFIRYYLIILIHHILLSTRPFLFLLWLWTALPTLVDHMINMDHFYKEVSKVTRVRHG